MNGKIKKKKLQRKRDQKLLTEQLLNKHFLILTEIIYQIFYEKEKQIKDGQKSYLDRGQGYGMLQQRLIPPAQHQCYENQVRYL